MLLSLSKMTAGAASAAATSAETAETAPETPKAFKIPVTASSPSGAAEQKGTDFTPLSGSHQEEEKKNEQDKEQ